MPAPLTLLTGNYTIANDLFGYAFFLVPGSYLQEDIPFIFEQSLKKFPGVTYELSPPMMSDPTMIYFVAKHAESVLGESRHN